MKQLNIQQIARIKKKVKSLNFELKEIYNRLEVTPEDLESPAILNSYFQIQMAIGALETFEDNAYRAFDKQIYKLTPKSHIAWKSRKSSSNRR